MCNVPWSKDYLNLACLARSHGPCHSGEGIPKSAKFSEREGSTLAVLLYSSNRPGS